MTTTHLSGYEIVDPLSSRFLLLVEHNIFDALLGVDELSLVGAFDRLVLLEYEHCAVGGSAKKLGLAYSTFRCHDAALVRWQVEERGQLVGQVDLGLERLVGECAVDEHGAAVFGQGSYS